MNVAKAVVLATERRVPEPWPDLGLATRHLAPVANKPVLFHQLEGLAAAGIGETAIVCDRGSKAGIRQAVGDGSAWNLDVRYLDASSLEGVLSSPAVARFVESEPVLVQHGDILLHDNLSELRDSFADQRLDVLVMHAGRSSLRVGIECYMFGFGVFSSLRHQAAPLRDALAQLRANGARIEERNVKACLPLRGGTDALLEANRRLLDRMAEDRCGERVFDSEIHGRVALDPSAEIRDSIIRGPVAIGPHARITNAYVGPYTSIGPGVEIDSAEIEYSIVLNDAQIRRVASRVESSVIGPGARVSHDFYMPRAVRLAIGEGAQVSLA